MRVRVDLQPDELRAVVKLVGARVSETGEERTPLERAERELDSALLSYENTIDGLESPCSPS